MLLKTLTKQHLCFFIAKWLENGRCGPNDLLPNGLIGECNPQSDTPCCNGEECGNTDEHCRINDYRVVYFGKFLSQYLRIT